MVRRLVVFVLILAAAAAAKDAIQKQTIEFGGHKRTYYVLVPAKAFAPAPLLLLLHGSAPGRDGRQMIEIWKDLATKEGIVLVAPDARNASAWNTKIDGPPFLHAIIEAVRATNPIDGKRMYVFGHSGGAVFGLIMAMAEPEYFAAAAVHAGALPPETHTWFDLSARKIPIKIFVGTEDPLFPLPAVRATRDFLKQNGIPVELEEIHRHDHNYYRIADKINSAAWEFLKGQQVAEPRYLGPES